MVARVVKYDDEGEVIYDGPARRGTDQSVNKPSGLPFGLTPADIMKLGMMLIFCVTFVVKTDQRLSNVEEAVKYLSTFSKNSDGWHSSLFGTQFEGGRPLNNDFDLNKFKRKEQQ